MKTQMTVLYILCIIRVFLKLFARKPCQGMKAQM